MIETTNNAGVSVYKFETAQEQKDFYDACAKNNAEDYVIERMIDGISQSFLSDLQSGTLKDTDPDGLDIEAPSNVLRIAAKFLADLVYKNALGKKAVWDLAHQAGLPAEGNWNFNKESGEFSAKPEDD